MVKITLGNGKCSEIKCCARGIGLGGYEDKVWVEMGMITANQVKSRERTVAKESANRGPCMAIGWVLRAISEQPDLIQKSVIQGLHLRNILSVTSTGWIKFENYDEYTNLGKNKNN